MFAASAALFFPWRADRGFQKRRYVYKDRKTETRGKIYEVKRGKGEPLPFIFHIFSERLLMGKTSMFINSLHQAGMDEWEEKGKAQHNQLAFNTNVRV